MSCVSLVLFFQCLHCFSLIQLWHKLKSHRQKGDLEWIRACWVSHSNHSAASFLQFPNFMTSLLMLLLPDVSWTAQEWSTRIHFSVCTMQRQVHFLVSLMASNPMARHTYVYLMFCFKLSLNISCNRSCIMHRSISCLAQTLSAPGNKCSYKSRVLEVCIRAPSSRRHLFSSNQGPHYFLSTLYSSSAFSKSQSKK